MGGRLVQPGSTPWRHQAEQLQPQWSLQGQPVEQVQSYKYLGILFDAVKGVSESPKHLARAGERALYAVKGMCYSQDI